MGRPAEGRAGAPRAALVLVLALALLGSLLAGAAGADEEGEFERHLDHALSLYQDQRYEEAIGELQAAQALRDDPRLLLNLGHAYRRLGNGEEALRHYQLFLDRSPGLAEAERVTVQDYMDKARALLRPAVPPAPPGPAPVAPGPAPSTGPMMRARSVPLEPRTAVSLTAPGPRPAPRVPPEPPVYRRWWFWGLMGLAAAGVVTIAVVSSQPWDAGIPPGVPLHDARF